MKRFHMLASLILACVWSFSLYAHEDGIPGNTRTFNVSNGGTLEVTLSGGDIEVATAKKGQVTVISEGEDEDESGVTITQVGTTIRVSDGSGNGDDLFLRITVPPQFNLNLSTANGDITVKGDMTGKISCQTSAGNILTGDITGVTVLRTSGGDVTTGRVEGNATLTTSGGEIQVSSSSGELDLRSSGGDLRVGNVGKAVHAKTAGGDIIIGDVGGEAIVSTAGGNISLGHVAGSASLATAGGDVNLKGASGKTKVSTSGGNIELTDLTGTVSASTSGGDIEAELHPSGKGKSSLSSSAGTIRLFLPEDARVTVEAHIMIRGWWGGRHEEYSIRSDFKAEPSESSADEQEIQKTFVLNGGGEQIRVETVNSDIEIRKMRK
jgi:DUF4097 and DUF4098 domain-containing protein YvlB